jgi:hypothetical protein
MILAPYAALQKSFQGHSRKGHADPWLLRIWGLGAQETSGSCQALLQPTLQSSCHILVLNSCAKRDPLRDNAHIVTFSVTRNIRSFDMVRLSNICP